MSCVMKLNQKQNESINSMTKRCKRLFCGTHFTVISNYDAEFNFNDGANKRYHLLIQHNKLEQLKNIWE